LVYGVTYGMGQRVEEPMAAVLADTSSPGGPDVGDAASLDLHSQGVSMLLAYLCLGSFVVVDRTEDRLCNTRKRSLLFDKECPCAKTRSSGEGIAGRAGRLYCMQGMQGPAPPESGMLMTGENDTRRELANFSTFFREEAIWPDVC